MTDHGSQTSGGGFNLAQAANLAQPQKSAELPLAKFLNDCWSAHKDVRSGEVADYIPELSNVDPQYFGIAIATIDGFVHTVGDADIEFTIQSISKAFVFALALELLGNDEVLKTIGVEPSGEAFNSIRLSPDNRPFNPMVNAGAIACTGLIYSVNPLSAFDMIHEKLGQFAGRNLAIDETVFESERKTGDRNRAIAWLLRNYGKLSGDVTASVDVYFKQCSILVTARDLAVMGATLANNGRNPVTDVTVVSPETCARVLSIMSSCGMYDYSGEWIYRVGLPAKSGVGGGIVATLPAQMGMGTFSPRLDPLGNSVRGVKVCENVSSHFELHVLKSQSDINSYISADYDLSNVQSNRDRRSEDLAILRQHGHQVRVLEFAGTLNFIAADFLSRRLSSYNDSSIVVFDFRKVTAISGAAAKLIALLIADYEKSGGRIVISSLSEGSTVKLTLDQALAHITELKLNIWPVLNEAITWAEDQIIFLYGGSSRLGVETELAEQALLQSLNSEQLLAIRNQCELLEFSNGEKLIKTGEPADSIYFLLSGMVSVKLETGTRIATLDAGTCFGEFALISPNELRSADVIADTPARCLKLQLNAFDKLRTDGTTLDQIMTKNLVVLMVQRLRSANAKIAAQSN